MQNNQSKDELNQNFNPNYPYSKGPDEDYNQYPSNDFPSDFYDRNQPNVSPNVLNTNFTNQRPQQDNNVPQSVEIFTNTLNSIQERPKSPLVNETEKEIINQQSYRYPPSSENYYVNNVPNAASKYPEKESTNFVVEPQNISIEHDQSKSNKKQNHGNSGLKMVTMLVFVLIISVASSTLTAIIVSNNTYQKEFKNNIVGTSSSASEVVTTKVTDEQSAIIDAVSVARESVVSVIISKDVSTTKNRVFDIQNNSSKSALQVGAGTGFIVSNQGYIVTNRHVVEDTKAIYSVVLDNNIELKATVLGRDPLLDIAILKVDPDPKLKPLKLGNSSGIKVGQTAITIGNSLGEFNNSVSRGIIAGLGRTITAGSDVSKSVETLEGIIQTDASINPGNSGGPLLDVNGLVIGVNVAKSNGADNIAFSIPIDDVKQLLESVLSTGKIQRPYLGIQYVLVDDELATQDGLSVNYGAYIGSQDESSLSSIVKDSPASKVGLKEKDIVLEINGTKITVDNDLRKMIQKFKVGDTITLKVLRDKKEIELKPILEELKE